MSKYQLREWQRSMFLSITCLLSINSLKKSLIPEISPWGPQRSGTGLDKKKKHPGSLFYMSEQISVEKFAMLSDAFFIKNWANSKSQIPHSVSLKAKKIVSGGWRLVEKTKKLFRSGPS